MTRESRPSLLLWIPLSWEWRTIRANTYIHLNSFLNKLDDVVDLYIVTVLPGSIQEITLAPGAGADDGLSLHRFCLPQPLGAGPDSKVRVCINDAAALVTIWAYEGEATPATLSRQLFLEPRSVSELIIRMEKKGLVKKMKNRKRGNMVRISITEKGREICSDVVQVDFIRSIMSSLSGEQQEQLWSCLSVLYNTVLKELSIANDNPLLCEP